MNDYANTRQLEKPESPDICVFLIPVKEQALKMRDPNICIQEGVDEGQPVNVTRGHPRLFDNYVEILIPDQIIANLAGVPHH